MKRTELKSKTTLKSTSKLKSTSTLKTKKRINGKSDKQKSIDEEYHKIKSKKFDEYTVCTGCNKSTNVTPSHLIPRSFNRSLVAIKENIVPHCLENGCHEKWESPGRVELLDYEENKEAVRNLDEKYYSLLLRDEEEWQQD